jgi:hypothetical protein
MLHFPQPGEIVGNLTMSIDQWKMIIGTVALISLVALVMVLGLGHVEEKTSFGLMPIVTALAGFLGGFSTWAFGNNKSDK